VPWWDVGAGWTRGVGRLPAVGSDLGGCDGVRGFDWALDLFSYPCFPVGFVYWVWTLPCGVPSTAQVDLAVDFQRFFNEKSISSRAVTFGLMPHFFNKIKYY
jgi:hypothetical protein